MTRTDRRTRQGGKRPATGRSRGFTLIELITVIIIMGILSVFIFSSSGNLNPAAAARASELKSQLRFVQLRAMKLGEYCGLKCDGTYYWAYNGTDPGNSTRTDFIRIVLPGETANQVSLAGKPMTLNTFAVAFDSLGIPYSYVGSAPTKLTTPLTISITAAGQSATLSLAPETGFIP